MTERYRCEPAANGDNVVDRLLYGIAVASMVSACGGQSDVPTSNAGTSNTGTSKEMLVAGNERIAQVLTETDLVADEPTKAAQVDPQLVNAWGISFSTTGKPWVSDNGTGLTTVYDATGALLLTVTIPPPRGQEGPSKPTGQVANADAATFMGDRFIFVTEDGTVSGWQPANGSTAILHVDNSSAEAIYKGVALAQARSGPRLYAADFHNAKVAVFDANYAPVRLPGRFFDPFLPAGYAPFNVFANGDMLLVAYAKQALPEKEDDEAGKGHGFIDAFDTEGHFTRRLVSRGALNSPWGMAFAPADFGHVSGRLLVGNFGDGKIHTYELEGRGRFLHAEFEGAIGATVTEALTIPGLWALVFAPDAGGLDSRQLFFSAGPDDEGHGLFGRLDLAN